MPWGLRLASWALNASPYTLAFKNFGANIKAVSGEDFYECKGETPKMLQKEKRSKTTNQRSICCEWECGLQVSYRLCTHFRVQYQLSRKRVWLLGDKGCVVWADGKWMLYISLPNQRVLYMTWDTYRIQKL